jgi:hypothetical protein
MDARRGLAPGRPIQATTAVSFLWAIMEFYNGLVTNLASNQNNYQESLFVTTQPANRVP